MYIVQLMYSDGSGVCESWFCTCSEAMQYARRVADVARRQGDNRTHIRIISDDGELVWEHRAA